jgi:hypothetical protein
MNFDMNAVWTRAMELLSGSFSLLLVIAAVFVLLPTVAIYLLIPDFQALADPTADPEAMLAQMSELLVPLLSVSGIATLFQFVGYSAMIAMVGGQRPTVGQAIATGFKTLPSLIVVTIVFIVAYILIALVLIVPVALLAAAASVPALAVIAVLPVLAAVIWIMTRMSLSMPALVLGKTLNPISAIGESVRLTGPKQWTIMIFWVLIVVTFTVISLVISSVTGLLASLAGPGLASMLILGIVNGAVSMVSGIIVCTVAAAMYAQLAGPGQADIEETFG